MFITLDSQNAPLDISILIMLTINGGTQFLMLWKIKMLGLGGELFPCQNKALVFSEF